MTTRTFLRRAGLASVGALALVVGGAIAPVAAAEPDPGLPGSDLYLNPFNTTLEAAQSLSGQARDDAQLLGSIPSGNWITSGTPEEAQAAVAEIVDAAEQAGEMPLLVAYNLPFRDCAQYSAGGAYDTAEYTAWIDGVAAGIGDRAATVILEPDGLGIIPHYTTLDDNVEWCQPADLDADTAAADRFEQLNYAVDALKAGVGTSVYLDGTGASWLNVGEISDRLLKAGVERSDGFFLNASNYQFTTNTTYYGTWISSCIAYVTQVDPGAFGACGNQYWNGGPVNDWNGVAMSPYGEWSNDAVDPALNTAGVDSRYADQLGGVQPTTSFVIDTSRNGLGPWQPPTGVYSDAEDWCNPPDRGAGTLPTTDTGNPLVDAYLWIKVPGESDGQCFRGTEGPLDPERGMQDPAAGQWFTQQARELVALASPALEPLTCHVDWKVSGNGKSTAARVDVTAETAAWQLRFLLSGDQRVASASHGAVTQDGAAVTLAGRTRNGNDAVMSLKGGADTPWIFWADGAACTS